MLGALLWLTYTVSGQVTFQQLTSLDVPDTPYELAKGDLNNDGLIDLVTANFTGLANQQITVLLNTGTGTFGGSNIRNFAATAFVIDVAVGDFNEDGNLDVVACSANDDNFSLLLGSGTGNLSAPSNFASGNGPQGIAVGDMNKDSNLDVLVSHSGSPDDVYIFLGTGTGSFSAPITVPIPVNTGWDIAVGDFNLDTNPDFALSTAGVYTVQIWTGNGGASPVFTSSQTITGFGINPDVDAADLDDDGDADILAGNGYSLNDGSGTFAPRVLLGSYAEFAVGRFNGDAILDIVATDQNTNGANTVVLLGTGTGTFLRGPKFETNCFAYGLATLDLNNDGLLDVVGAGNNSTQGKVDILLGDGTGNFPNAVAKFPTPTDPRDMVKGDFNEDGLVDVALCHSVGNFVSVHLGQAGGRFAKTPANHPTGVFPVQIITVDYNNDNHLDLVVSNQTSGSLTVMTGAGDGSFTLLTTIPVTGGAGSRIAAADFNNDTFIDLAVSGTTNNIVSFLAGTGSGFSAPVTSPVSSNAYDIASSDFTGDGKQDLVVALSAFQIVLLTGTGTGTFTETPTLYPANGSYFLVSDINGDSSPDVIFFSNSGTGSDFFINDGAGNFTGSSISVSLGGIPLAHVDMNGDGFKDLVVGAQNPSSSQPGRVVVFRGTATGITNTVLIDKDFSGGNRLVVHDVTGDGKPDVITTSFYIYEDYLGVLVNTTTLVGCPTISVHPSPQVVCEGGSANFSVTASGNAPLTYTWRKGGVPIGGATSVTFSLSTVTAADAATYSVMVSNGCGSITSNNASLTVNPVPPSPTTSGGSRCGSGTVTLSAGGGLNGDYRWYSVASGGTAVPAEVNDTFAIPPLTATATYYVSLTNGSCESARVPAIAVINPLPAKPAIVVTGTTILCLGQTVQLQAPAGFSYAWSNLATTAIITVAAAGSYSVVVTDANTCSSPASDAVVITETGIPCSALPPVILPLNTTSSAGSLVSLDLAPLVSDPDGNLDLSSLAIVVPPSSGAPAMVAGTTLSIDYQGISFSGLDQLSVQACDLTGLCTQQTIYIEVVGDVVIFNGVSPNSDGLNDYFLIQYVDLLGDTRENRVHIFNRWGDNVWEGVNYDNAGVVFRGLSQDGKELPSGTYFYRIDFVGGRPSLKGSLTLRR
jgi:gliding motility-associated-like protein